MSGLWEYPDLKKPEPCPWPATRAERNLTRQEPTEFRVVCDSQPLRHCWHAPSPSRVMEISALVHDTPDSVCSCTTRGNMLMSAEFVNSRPPQLPFELHEYHWQNHVFYPLALLGTDFRVGVLQYLSLQPTSEPISQEANLILITGRGRLETAGGSYGFSSGFRDLEFRR